MQLSFEGLSAVDPKMEALPEVALLDFMLQSQYFLNLRETANLHRRVGDYTFYSGKNHTKSYLVRSSLVYYTDVVTSAILYSFLTTTLFAKEYLP